MEHLINQAISYVDHALKLAKRTNDIPRRNALHSIRITLGIARECNDRGPAYSAARDAALFIATRKLIKLRSQS